MEFLYGFTLGIILIALVYCIIMILVLANKYNSLHNKLNKLAREHQDIMTDLHNHNIKGKHEKLNE